MRVLLVNTNRVQPPIAPVGLTVRGRPASRRARGGPARPVLCDRPVSGVDRQLARAEYGLIGVTFRNTDGCYYPGGWFVPELASVVRQLRQGSQAPLVLGGVASPSCREILRAVNADGGVMGEGEFALLRLANGDTAAPGVIWRRRSMAAAPPQPADLASLPPMRRDFVDNARYHREAASSVSRPRRLRGALPLLRRPVARAAVACARPKVAGELAGLAAQGLIHLHTCDAEFNRPLDPRWRCAGDQPA